MRVRPLPLALVAALLLAGCQSGELPAIDGPSGGATTGGAELPACPASDAPREYDPPPEEQPDADPGRTHADLIEDLDVGDGVSGHSAPDDGGEELPRTAPDARGEQEPGNAPDAAPPAPTDPMSAAQRWAEAEAPEHFAGVWLDAEHGAPVIAFTDDLDRYASEVRDRFGPGWWVVRAERSAAELRDLADAVGDTTAASGAVAGQPGSVVSWGPREDRGVVSVEVVGGDEQAVAELAAQLDDPAYCFAVLDPPARPDADGHVRTLATVAGWRDGFDHERHVLLEIADDRETAQRLIDDNVPADLDDGPDGEPWQDGRHGDLADVDLDTHVVAVYSAGRSGSCPEWVADVRTTEGGVVVDTEVPTRGACTDDFNPYRTIVAIERDRVPAADELPVALDMGHGIEEEAVIVYGAG